MFKLKFKLEMFFFYLIIGRVWYDPRHLEEFHTVANWRKCVL